MSEAPLREARHGLTPEGDGWFVVNARQTRWRDYGPLGFGCSFEGKKQFKEFGLNVNVLQPGESLGLYHRENHQEDFLVLAGECVLVVEGDERRLRAWDFFHSPPRTAHVVVGAGDGPAVVLAVGGRGGRSGLRYLAEPAAERLGASPENDTSDYREAYVRFPWPKRTRYGEGWLPDLT